MKIEMGEHYASFLTDRGFSKFMIIAQALEDKLTRIFNEETR